MNKKPKKQRAKKYEKKLKVKATFDEILIGMASRPPPKKEKEVEKKSKKKE
jgi:hypothetical protein